MRREKKPGRGETIDKIVYDYYCQKRRVEHRDSLEHLLLLFEEKNFEREKIFVFFFFFFEEFSLSVFPSFLIE